MLLSNTNTFVFEKQRVILEMFQNPENVHFQRLKSILKQ